MFDTTTTADLIAASVLEIGDGYRAKNSEFVDGGGLPFVRVGNVSATIDLNDLDELPVDARGKYEPKVSEPFDSVITMKGSVGRVAYVTEAMRPFVYSPQLSYWRSLQPDVVHPRWLRFWLESPEFDAQARATKGATDMADYINLRDQRRMRITLPSLAVQRSVARVLGAFDDLIENNRRRIEILEEMARLIYREWFVHFRFPGHEDVELVNSHLGPIPEGWERETLADAAHLVMGQSPKSEYYNDDGIGLPFHQGVTNFGARYPEHRKWCTQENRIAEEGDVLLSVRAPVGRINVAPDRLVIGRGLAALRSTRGTQVFLFETLREIFAEEDSMGGGTIFKAVTKGDLERIGVVRPPASVAEAFEVSVGPMFHLVGNLTRQNRVLAEARDLLLPRLISGELDVSDLDLDLDSVA